MFFQQLLIKAVNRRQDGEFPLKIFDQISLPEGAVVHRVMVGESG
jgi:hypothetical protein